MTPSSLVTKGEDVAGWTAQGITGDHLSDLALQGPGIKDPSVLAPQSLSTNSTRHVSSSNMLLHVAAGCVSASGSHPRLRK
jgi:hypothetical protein